MKTELYCNTYRVSSSRAPWWNYSRNGVYFITICTKNRKYHFGHIDNGTMILSAIGQIAHDCWAQIPAHFPYVTLGEFVVMPNHVHGIIFVNGNENGDNTNNGNNVNKGNIVDTRNLRVSTINLSHTENIIVTMKNTVLGIIINQYKRFVTIQSRKIQNNFKWQSRFYDRIIRDEIEYQRIAQYIINNPANWDADRNNRGQQ